MLVLESSFLLLGLLACAMSIAVLFMKTPVSAAMSLICIMLILGGMYGLLGAHFSPVAQIIVYAGAIMIVFVFVIMLLNLPKKDMDCGCFSLFDSLLGIACLGLSIFGFVFLFQGKFSIKHQDEMPFASPPFYPESFGENVKNIAAQMFTDYLWAFEIISILILVAIVGAVVISKKERKVSYGTNNAESP